MRHRLPFHGSDGFWRVQEFLCFCLPDCSGGIPSILYLPKVR
jgi:hypothetical protein